ncbi:leucine-rich repeat protein [Prevotella salivae]|uniref:leucine-rich repeat protein n=1 Tax=Segatella salivae TaxID=228604 RepID=UPI001C5CE902|nr:leucine-rich repeat protein [Segatella salivae]MBW4907443.1 leucine-rich repeat protein [Segatella salivae]
MIKHVSYKIQNAIQIELFGAKKSIKIAVAWFTNKLLLHPLVLKLQTGVNVEIILNDDNINKGGESSLDFTSFLEAGGILRWNTSKQLLHEKFCIIDDRIVISGSYNWTNKAEYNDEVETFYFDEQETCGFFNSQFLKLQRKYEATKRIRPTQVAEIEELEEKITTNEPILEEPKYFIDEYGVVYSENKKILLKGIDIDAYAIIKGTEEIADEAFAHCNTIEGIYMPESLCKIGKRAFFHCERLEDIYFPSYISSIGDEAFRGCCSLQFLDLDSVGDIGDYCFSDCSQLEEVIIECF